MKGVILHGGSGTRLRPLTYTDVKQLLPLAGKPVSEYALMNLVELGISEISIILGEIGAHEVQEYYGDGSKWNVSITYIFQGKPLGIAHAISLVKDFVNSEPFVVVLGDNYFHNGLTSMKKAFLDDGYEAYLGLTEVSQPSQFGIAEVSNDKIISIVEKPKNPKSNLAVTGVYFLRPSIFEVISTLKPSWRNELEITEALQKMLTKEHKLGYTVIDGWWKDTGTVSEFLDCNRMVLDKINRSISKTYDINKISGRANIHPSVAIKGNTRILGPCYIGKDAIIEDSYIGPYTSIGSNCQLKNIETEDSVIMDNCDIIGKGDFRISRSLIGANVKIRPSGSRTGDICLILGRDSRLEL